MTSQSDFEYAREHPHSRGEFVASIDLEDAKPFVKEVAYRDKGICSYRFIMRCSPPILSLLGIKGIKSKITVYPMAFDRGIHKQTGDFLSALVDHEGNHARQIFTDPIKYFNPLLDLPRLYLNIDQRNASMFLRESECLSNQLDNLVKRGLSELFETEVAARLRRCQELKLPESLP